MVLPQDLYIPRFSTTHNFTILLYKMLISRMPLLLCKFGCMMFYSESMHCVVLHWH